MIDQRTRCSLTASSGTRGTLRLAIVVFAPVALAMTGTFYYTLALHASTLGQFPLWDVFRLSVHDINPTGEYRLLGLHLIAREYLYESVFFGFFAVITAIGAVNHWLLRARDRRIVALLERNGLL